MTRGRFPAGVKTRRAAIVRFFHDPDEAMVGVSPRSAQVRRTTGFSEMPDSSSNPSQNPCMRAHFFYAREFPSFPVLYGFFVAFRVFELGLLRGEAQLSHHLPCSDGAKFHPRRFLHPEIPGFRKGREENKSINDLIDEQDFCGGEAVEIGDGTCGRVSSDVFSVNHAAHIKLGKFLT